jgi:hypothetical protein
MVGDDKATTRISSENDYLDLQRKAATHATALSAKAAEATAEAKTLKDRADNADSQSDRDDLTKRSDDAAARAAQFQKAAGQADHQADLYGQAATTEAQFGVVQQDAERLHVQANDAISRMDEAVQRGVAIRRDYAAAQGRVDQITKDVTTFQQGADEMRADLAKAEQDGNTVRAAELRDGIAHNEQIVAQ